MGNAVFANKREISCKSGQGKSICAFPDVCFTPPQTPATPPGVPVPYPNTGLSRDTTSGSRTVKIAKKEIMLKNKSYFKKSMGDEAGCAPKKGVITSVNRGKVYFNSWSMDVKAEGQNVVRHLDLTTHNHASPPPQTPPTPEQEGMAVPGGPPPKCPPHEWQRLEDDDTPDERIEKLEKSPQSGDQYNACVAKKYKAAGRKVDVSARFKCDVCGEYQEVDLIADDQLHECKAGNQGAKKHQTLNYIDISNVLFGGAPVTVLFQSPAKAAREKPHVEKWGAKVKPEPCP